MFWHNKEHSKEHTETQLKYTVYMLCYFSLLINPSLLYFQANFPLPWHPRVVSISTIWLADLLILGVPGEPTTMSGRRMRQVAGDVMRVGGFEPRIVVSGLTNEYIHYVATREEYRVRHVQ